MDTQSVRKIIKFWGPGSILVRYSPAPAWPLYRLAPMAKIFPDPVMAIDEPNSAPSSSSVSGSVWKERKKESTDRIWMKTWIPKFLKKIARDKYLQFAYRNLFFCRRKRSKLGEIDIVLVPKTNQWKVVLSWIPIRRALVASSYLPHSTCHCLAHSQRHRQPKAVNEWLCHIKSFC